MQTKKKKFKPIITRVKLNPEQAVLTCDCWNTGSSGNAAFGFARDSFCGSKGFPDFGFGYQSSSTAGS